MATQQLGEAVRAVRSHFRATRNRSFLHWRFSPDTVDPHDGGWTLRWCEGAQSIQTRGSTDFYVATTGGMKDIGADYIRKELNDEALGGLFADLKAWLRQPSQRNIHEYNAMMAGANVQFVCDLGRIRVFVSFSYRGWGDFMCAVNNIREPHGYMRYY